MDVELMKEWFTIENVMDLLNQYRSFGPIPGILLPMLEAFLPFLPLFYLSWQMRTRLGCGLDFSFPGREQFSVLCSFS